MTKPTHGGVSRVRNELLVTARESTELPFVRAGRFIEHSSVLLTITHFVKARHAPGRIQATQNRSNRKLAIVASMAPAI